MNDLISPKYLMKLVKSVEEGIWVEYNSYKEVELYVKKWHQSEWDINGGWENFEVVYKDVEKRSIDLLATLHNMPGEILLKVAIDIGVDTPYFIPSIPIFRNELKSNYKTAYDTFTKAYKQIDNDPSIAVGLANSALESIIKEILKDDRFFNKITGKETLYKLTSIILKEFNLQSAELPVEIKTIGSSLLSVNQSIEKLRSEKTNFHGKTNEDYLINDKIYTFFIINSVVTVGLFLDSFYKMKFPRPIVKIQDDDDLPF